ncbi:coagulation factor V [Misgurnus anguillicaudatus]|uniref:coagulation factor V n=1 Tax=Misgurnus anguillicaudatus TaxID=75329 RepID=UPI003CCFABE8
MSDMQLCSWPGAQIGLALLALLCHTVIAVERRYYIAAVNIQWDYTSDTSDVQQRAGPTYKKTVYREYDAGFTKAKTHPSSSGLLGPTIRGQEGDTIVVTFKNMADHPCSIHPHGITYGKQSEGSLYFDNTILLEKEDDVILPGKEHTYYWEVTSEVTPLAADPPCITYTYLSHVDIVKDYNTGLIGALLICKKGALDDSGNQINFHQEAVLLFGVFDENMSLNSTDGPPQAQNIKYTINGYTNGSVPDLGICAHSKVSWHMLGMSSEPELFSVHFNGQVLLHYDHKTSAIGIISGTATSASMTAVFPGRWLFSSHISRHLEAGLHGYLNIRTCEQFPAPKRRLTIQQKEESQEWTYYIAAEEVLWDYAPNMPENIDWNFRSKYLKQGPQRIGKKYKKAVFTHYKDGTFKERAEDKQRKKELGILGPVIRAQIRDVIKIVFKNKASRPYSIYPHGLTIDKSAEGASYPAGGNQTHGVQPGETYTYVWNVGEEDEPTDSDSRCLTRMYHSAVDTPRDIASGLVGPLLICKSQSLNKKNVQLKSDKEQHAMFTVFDENKSWYHDENINTYCSDPKKVKKDDPEFYKSNVMHTINGYVYESGAELGFCHGEIVTWHVSSVGEQDYIQTTTFYGHIFELKNREEDMLSLFPMTGETISMEMVNIGIWLLASLNSHDSTKGMRVKFKDLECFRDYVMEEDYDKQETFTVLKPQLNIETVNKKPKPTVLTEVDLDTEIYADLLKLRTFRNTSTDSELLDLSFLDHDDRIFLSTEDVKNEMDKSHNADKPETFTVLKPQLNNETVKEKPIPTEADKETDNSADILNLRTFRNTSTDSELLDLSFFDHDDSIFLRTEDVKNEMDKSPIATLASSNQTRAENVSTDGADLEKQLLNQNVMNEITVEGSLNITSTFDYDSEIVANNKTKSETHFPVRSASVGPVNETASISTNATNFLKNSSIGNVSFQYYGNSSLEMMNETDSVFANTTHLSFNGKKLTLEEPTNEPHSLSSNTSVNLSPLENISMNSTNFLDSVRNSSIGNPSSHYYGNSSLEMMNETDRDLSFNGRNFSLEEPMNETNSLSLNTSVNSSVPVGDRNIPVEDDGKDLTSTEEMHLLSNQTLEYDVLNKTDLQNEQSSLNSTSTVDDNSEISSHSFIYSVSSSDSLYNRSEPQEEEDFVLLDGEHLLKISKDEKTFENLPTVFPKNTTQDFSESTDDPFTNTTGMSIQELNGTRWNYTTPYLNFSAPSTNSTIISNTTLSYSNDTFEILNNVSPLFHSNSTENISVSLGYSNVSSTMNSSEDSLEEVAIYLKNNHSEVILTSPLNSKEEHWGYEGTHELVQMEMPDEMKKYITDQPAAKINNPKKKKVVHHRVKPRKGHAIKTKKRKEYKPQPPSNVSPMGLSPRGFAPAGLTPRGIRPVSSEEELGNKAIVIGVPRKDFKDYDLYVPNQVEDFEDFLHKPEEYEFVEYKDPYSAAVDVQSMEFDATSQNFLKKAEDKNTRTYFITAEEEEWDYAGFGQKRVDKPPTNERQTAFKKVVFRKYLDSTFSIRDIRGEMDEHLGILGPVIKAEVDQTIMIFFRNRASRPYSLHPNGVHYLKQMEGLSYEDQSPYWYKQDDAVQPNSSHVYIWTVNSKSGPQNNKSDCRTWTYYSGVNPERDINSGLIGPLLVCRKGTLAELAMDRREFVLLFMTFDENKSWYYEENWARIERKNRRAVLDPNFHESLKFDAINGIIYSLKGLRMYTNQLANWHLINMGSPKDLHSVHFHGQTFINKNVKDHRQGVYPLLPGGFATLEMLPSKPGLWLLESEVGLSQQRGMQTLFLVLDNVCDHPLGLISGTVKDEHITASDSRGHWLPHLARLHNTGKYNAWSTTQTGQYIQVDFQRPVVISKVSTQGAKQLGTHNFVLNYTISYSTDKRKWIFYKGDSDAIRKNFKGNRDAYEVKENIFFPPLIGRYVRLHPLQSYNYPTVRLEYFGCELDGCSVPLGMQSGDITDNQITASTVAFNWYTKHWHPWYARLNKQGTTNAWQAKNNDMQQWIQVEFPIAKKITGIITQGAKSLYTEMFVTTFALEYSDDGKKWMKYTDDKKYAQKVFQANTDNNSQVKNFIYPPIFSRFIRVVPIRWQSSITMRIELLGCDF